MIVVRRTKNLDEIKIIEELLKKNDIVRRINEDNIFFVMEDNDTIVGGSGIMLNNGYAVIDFLLIEEDRRREKLGDGLLRAVLNFCFRSGVNKALFFGDNQYLIKKGFYKADKNVNDLTFAANMSTDSILTCDIENFFNKGCSSCRKG